MKAFYLACISILLAQHVLAQSIQPNTDRFLTIDDMIIVDANNHSLGRAHLSELVGSLNDVDVFLHVNDTGEVIRIPIKPWGFTQTRILLGFASTDCTGPAYLVTLEPQGVFTHAAITPPGHTLWVPEVDAQPEGFFFQSHLRHRGEDDVSDCDTVSLQSASGPRARILLDLDSVYTPPFRVMSSTHVHRQTTRTFTGPGLIRAIE